MQNNIINFFKRVADYLSSEETWVGGRRCIKVLRVANAQHFACELLDFRARGSFIARRRVPETRIKKKRPPGPLTNSHK